MPEITSTEEGWSSSEYAPPPPKKWLRKLIEASYKKYFESIGVKFEDLMEKDKLAIEWAEEFITRHFYESPMQRYLRETERMADIISGDAEAADEYLREQGYDPDAIARQFIEKLREREDRQTKD